MLFNSSWAVFHPQYYGKNDKCDEFTPRIFFGRLFHHNRTE